MRMSRLLGLSQSVVTPPTPSGDVTRTIGVYDYTYRYLQLNTGWKTPHEWVNLGFQVSDNIFGFGESNEYNSMKIPVSAMQFTGMSTHLRLDFGQIYTPATSINHTYRWAVCTQQNDSNYQRSNEVADGDGQLAHGTFTLSSTGGGYIQTGYTFDVSVPSNTNFYIYIWQYNSTYGNCHARGNVTITLS